MLQQDKPDDFVIATGEIYSLQDYIETELLSVGSDWRVGYVQAYPSSFRPANIAESKENPQKALGVLGWRTEYNMKGFVKIMVDCQLGGEC